MTEEIESHIYKKFEILQKLGKGAYGIVWKAIDKKTKKTIGLKKVFDAFHNSTDAQRTFREVMILQELHSHENIIKLLSCIKAENHKDLYLVFEYMETDLHKVIKAKILKNVHKRYIIYQLLKGLKYMHSGAIIHRDLKPSNLLLNSECLLKIADFGLARSVLQKKKNESPLMTEYVATRWYRAPEIVLGSNRYSKAVDIWSVGCILGELLVGKALFPGKSTLNQIEVILEVIGKPCYGDVMSIESENALSVINSIGVRKKKNFGEHFGVLDFDTLDFLERCLAFNPKKRMTVEECLEHPFVAQFHDPIEERVMEKVVKISIDDNDKVSIDKYREALYSDIVRKRKKTQILWRQKYLKQHGYDIKDLKKANEFYKKLRKQRMKKKNDLMMKKKVDRDLMKKNDKFDRDVLKKVDKDLSKKNRDDFLKKNKEDILKKNREDFLKKNKEDFLKKNRGEYLLKKHSKDKIKKALKNKYLKTSSKRMSSHTKIRTPKNDNKKNGLKKNSISRIKKKYESRDLKKYSSINKISNNNVYGFGIGYSSKRNGELNKTNYSGRRKFF